MSGPSATVLLHARLNPAPGGVSIYLVAWLVTMFLPRWRGTGVIVGVLSLLWCQGGIALLLTTFSGV